ncbi:MAG: hypothetical protein QM538_03655 [Methylacidiphilales bacterium]|nr:hypothetical protein [Candidatus Methylacidiphilales bacterium]
MAITKVLITVKTYPVLSDAYTELVCTAGFREDGSWIRIYPVPFRKLNQYEQYHKYEWIEVDLIKNKKDFRPESYSPVTLDSDNNVLINKIGKIDTSNGWQLRKNIVLKKSYHDNMEELISQAKGKTCTSLAVIKPTEIIDFVIEKTEREWNPDKLRMLESKLDLLAKENIPFKIVKKLPYKFSYKFTSKDGKTRTLMIEDWELGSLYWNCLKRHGNNEQKACDGVRKKYYDEFIKKKDIYLFLGTTLANHKRSPDPFIIIGVFYPPISKTISNPQLQLNNL